MSDNNEMTVETTPLANAPAEPGTVFKGLSTHDGEVISPSDEGKSDKAPSKQQARSQQPPQAEPDELDDEDDEDDGRQRHKSAQTRINKAVGRQRAAERRADAAEAKLTSLESRLAALETGGGAQLKSDGKATGDAPPDPSKYEFGETDAKYIQDLVDYRVDRALKTQSTKSEETQRNQTLEQQQQEFMQARDEFLTKGLEISDDFEETVTDPDFRITPMLAELAFESDHGAQILYDAASDPKEMKRVSAMSPSRQAAWFGRMETELSSGTSDADEHGDNDAPPSSTRQKTSQAPEPPRGKARGSGKPQTVPADTTDFAAFERAAKAAHK